MVDSVKFDDHESIACDAIIAIIEGYLDPIDKLPRILVVLKNGAVLHLEVNELNLSAVAAWRAWKNKYGYSG